MKANPPFKPQIRKDDDTSHFDDVSDDEESPLKVKTKEKSDGSYKGDELPFIGYSFNKYMDKVFSDGRSSQDTIAVTSEKSEKVCIIDY